jgi:hypothetical protein
MSALFNLLSEIEAAQTEIRSCEFSESNWNQITQASLRHGFRQIYTGEDCGSYSTKLRAHVAKIKRDEIFGAAVRIAFSDRLVMVPPQATDNAELDLNGLKLWCIQAERRKQEIESQPSNPATENRIEKTAELNEQIDYKTAKWFEENTSVRGDSLRQAVSDGKFLRSVGPKGKKRYSLTDAKTIWGNDIVNVQQRESS